MTTIVRGDVGTALATETVIVFLRIGIGIGLGVLVDQIESHFTATS